MVTDAELDQIATEAVIATAGKLGFYQVRDFLSYHTSPRGAAELTAAFTAAAQSPDEPQPRLNRAARRANPRSWSPPAR